MNKTQHTFGSRTMGLACLLAMCGIGATGCQSLPSKSDPSVQASKFQPSKESDDNIRKKALKHPFKPAGEPSAPDAATGGATANAEATLRQETGTLGGG